ncbi:MAG: hypothetical protein VKK59_03255, partial [Vampirovibrionales bacterium]|nr:hypothetical protein [Vampirovibrionales bacterium]
MAVPLTSLYANIPRWVQHLSAVQQMGMVNRSLNEIIAVDGTKTVLAQNQQERKERQFRQGLFFLLGFILLPLQGRALTHAFARHLTPKNVPLGESLLRLTYDELQSDAKFKKALQRLFQADRKTSRFGKRAHSHSTPQFRHQIAKAKGNLLIFDLALAGALFGGLGSAKNAYGQFIRQSLPSNTLFYSWQPRAQQPQALQKALLSILIGSGMMAAGAMCLKHAALTPQRWLGPFQGLKQHLARLEHTHLTNGFLKTIPMMPPLTSMAAMVPMEVGEWISARSSKEQSDLLPVFAGVNLSFFGLTPLLNKLLNQGCSSIQSRIQSAQKQGLPKANIIQAAEHAARIFLLNYGLTWATIAGFILMANRQAQSNRQTENNSQPILRARWTTQQSNRCYDVAFQASAVNSAGLIMPSAMPSPRPLS